MTNDNETGQELTEKEKAEYDAEEERSRKTLSGDFDGYTKPKGDKK